MPADDTKLFGAGPAGKRRKPNRGRWQFCNRTKLPPGRLAMGNQRFLIQLSVGTMPHDKMLQAIELLGTRVAPAVRAEVARRERVRRRSRTRDRPGPAPGARRC